MIKVGDKVRCITTRVFQDPIYRRNWSGWFRQDRIRKGTVVTVSRIHGDTLMFVDKTYSYYQTNFEKV